MSANISIKQMPLGLSTLQTKPVLYVAGSATRQSINSSCKFGITSRSCGNSNRRLSSIIPKAKNNDNSPSTTDKSEDGGSLIGSLGLFALYAAIAGYAFFISPNQTPLRDSYFLEKLVGLGENDGVAINAVFTQLFFIMGVWPMVYAALLIPGGKSGNKVPVWPFVTASFGIGAFGLIPYFALWQPPKETPNLPPTKSDMEGVGNLMLKGMESPFLAYGLFAGASWCLFQAFTAGIPAWNEYFKLLQESRFVHVTSLDFLLCTAFAPFWMYNDAELRKWEPRNVLVPLFSIVPVFGPALYLCLRPRSQE